MSCRKQLSWYELFPLFSYIFLLGRCGKCKIKLSAQYPLVELASGVMFASVFYNLSYFLYFNSVFFASMYLYYVFMFSILLIIAVYDIKHKIIPDSLSFMFAGISFLSLFTSFSITGSFFHLPSFLELFSGIFLALPFFCFWFFSKGTWMGLGDAKLALGIGWFLGYSMGISAIVLSCWLGAILGVSLILISRIFKKLNYSMKSAIPFGPYLVLGTFISFLLNLNLFNF
jgi:leader peptidase (prepilin peptidase)/N-methyltransferase